MRKQEYNTSPIAGEERYVDYDDETAMWCVFGVDSGFAYSSWSDKNSAEISLNR